MKTKTYRKLQKLVQTGIGMIFISHLYLFMFLVKFRGFAKTKYLLIIAIITGLCLIGKARNHYKNDPVKFKKELHDLLSSDTHIKW